MSDPQHPDGGDDEAIAQVDLRGVAALVLLALAPATAQIPDEFTTLQLLPKDIEKRQDKPTMRLPWRLLVSHGPC